MWTRTISTTTASLVSFTLFLLATTTLTDAAGAGGNVNVGLVLQGGPDGTKEGTENALALQGLKEGCLPSLPASSGFQYKSCTPHIYTPSSETLGAYSGLIPSKTSENDFMMALGYFPSKAIQTAASSNGDKLFAIVDFEFTPPVGNIASVMFSEDQIGFLAGLLAGEVAKSRGGKVAVIGGVDQPSVRRQVNGFGSGVKISCQTCLAYGLYSGTFEAGDPKLRSTVFNLLVDRKVSVVFNAASIFGTLTLKNLTTQQGIYAIGSGSDEWVTNWAYGSVPGSEHVLSSVQTDYTVLVKSVVQSVLRANLTGGGTVFYGVNTESSQSAIKLAPAHEASGVFTKEMEAKMQGYVRDMTKGKLTTGVDHKSGDSRSSGSSSTSVQLLALTDKPSSTSNNNNKSSDTEDNTASSSRKNHASSFKKSPLLGILWFQRRFGSVYGAESTVLFSPGGLLVACLIVQAIDMIGPWMI
ncbi:MAG: basic membrane protein-domain-containing protein [Linnemannia gamsii]|nr:MAG: basic membrane protein-domain-containing protein [Linnemannia gamsii]